METTTKTLARINKVDILLVENGERLIPVKPICEALGINSNGQIERIKSDPILGSVNKMCLSTGADKKQYQMFAIPFRYVFGWLFTIDSEKVNIDARETVLRYQKECYDVLFNHFTAHAEFYEYKQSLVYEKNTQLRIIKAEFNTAKTRLEEAKKEFDEVMDMRFEDWQAQKQQLKIVFENGSEVNLTNAEDIKALDEY
jgi:hypothetical protein